MLISLQAPAFRVSSLWMRYGRPLAFVVLLQHFFIIFEVETSSWMRVGLLDAKAAVTLFFVLSGYVLTLSLRRNPVSGRTYLNFGIRRVLRLYPLHIAANLLALVVLVWIKGKDGFHNPAEMPAQFLSSSGPEIGQWILQLTLVAPQMQSDFANPPVWTLMTEAKVAVGFPFIAWALLRLPRIAGALIVVCLVLGSDWGARHLVGTVALLGQFAIGALIALLPETAFARFRIGSWITWTLVSLVLYSAVSLRYWTPNVWVAYYICSIGAAGLIIASISWNILNNLLAAVQRFFRCDISYGLYILHFPILMGLRNCYGDDIGIVACFLLFCAGLCITVGLSLVLMIFVERPAIKLGRFLTSRRAASSF